MSKNSIAHVRQSDGLQQLLIDHLLETSSISGQLAAKLNLGFVGQQFDLIRNSGKNISTSLFLLWGYKCLT
ncbi:CRISPR-associated protein Cas3 [Aggregatibacter kilianii]|uniref:CRISPR-associated protein Cas3 n=1 Tax=Aggregatibacter kilianii TaxID=2025884 RepID=UPI0028D417B9|nr:CRISPR-associated protein Cas3 [Aggregatibacter kilianii]